MFARLLLSALLPMAADAAKKAAKAAAAAAPAAPGFPALLLGALPPSGPQKLAWLVARFAAGTAVGLSLNALFKAQFGGVKPTKDRPDPVGGFPRYRWMLSVFGQAFFMTGCWIKIYIDAKGAYGGLKTWSSLRAWFLADAHECAAKGLTFEAWYLVILFSAQSRDMSSLKDLRRMSTSFILHHCAVMLTASGAFYLSGAFNIFTFISYVLELGSLWFNLHNLFPNSVPLDLAYHTTMLGSNVCGFVGGAWFVLNQSDGPQLWARISYGVITIGVTIGRQLHAWKDAAGHKHD